MAIHSQVLLGAFADEAANRKTAVEQFSALAAMGLSYYSPRFIDVEGDGEVKHVVELNKSQLARLNKLHDEFGMHVTSIGSRIGKVKLLDVDDGTHNAFVSPKKYLQGEVARTIRAAHALDAKLIRGFSFYHPRGEDPADHLPAAVERLGPIVDAIAEEGLVYGLEVEANLVGQNGRLLAELCRQVDRPNMVCIFDGGNLSHQGYSPWECYAEYQALRAYLGWMHIKDFQATRQKRPGEHVDEGADWNFVPANVGDSGHEFILRDLAGQLPQLQRKLKKLGVPGVFLELEPHLKGGGQFGGFSGPDGMGVALRGLCSLLDYAGIGYQLRSFEDIRQLRGF